MAEFTGRHMLIVTVGAFSVIIAVNVLMAFKAVSTFPGLEVDNSYVASQEFNKKRAAQESLGWTFSHLYDRGQMKLAFTDAAGNPVEVAELSVLIGRTTDAGDDTRPVFTWLNGIYEADVPLAPGPWMIRVTAKSRDGILFEKREEFLVRS